jgi:hypothetical protein
LKVENNYQCREGKHKICLQISENWFNPRPSRKDILKIKALGVIILQKMCKKTKNAQKLLENNAVIHG